MQADEMSPEEVERVRKEYEDRSVGPEKVGVIMDPRIGNLVPVLQVRETPDTIKVFDAHDGVDEDLDVTTQWGALRQDEKITLVLLVEWAALGVELVLMFDPHTERGLLEVIAQSDVLGLAAVDKPFDLERTVMTETPYDELLAAVLAMTKEAKG